MIIESLLNVVYTLFNVLTLPIRLPQLPDSAVGYLESFFEYIDMGMRILGNYTHLSYLLALFVIVGSVDLGIGLYRLVMFVLRKIPFLGIE